MFSSGYGVETDLSIFKDTMVEMTWVEVEESANNKDIVLLPIGIVEEHGPHMDLSPDIYMAYHFCKYLKNNLALKGIQAIIAPPLYWGVSEAVKHYPGTFSIRPETMKALLVDIFQSLNSWGFQKVFIVNAHGDHTHIRMIEEAITITNKEGEIQIYDMGNLDVRVENPPVFPKMREDRFEPDYHAGANETAAMFAFYPRKGNRELAKELMPQSSFDPLGYCGDPASYEKEINIFEYFRADIEMDSLKIETITKMK